MALLKSLSASTPSILLPVRLNTWGTQPATWCPKGCEEVTIRLLAKKGALGIGALQDNGETLFVPLKRIRTQRQKDKAAYRFYNQYGMPKEYATREITVRLHNSAEEEARRLNRAENLRAIPPEDPDFDRLYARRGDAESLNRNLEDSLYLKKAHSLGTLPPGG